MSCSVGSAIASPACEARPHPGGMGAWRWGRAGQPSAARPARGFKFRPCARVPRASRPPCEIRSGRRTRGWPRSSGSGHGFALSRRNPPELCFVALPSRAKRAQGRPSAGGTRGPLRENAHAGRTAQQHTGEAQHTAFPARWSDGLCRALPGAEFLLASLTPAKFTGAAPVGATAAFARA